MLLKLFIYLLVLVLSFDAASLPLKHSKQIFCETEIVSKASDLNVETSYDCSGLGLHWDDLETSLIDPTYSASSLSLASNNFSQMIVNKTFNVFKLLDKTLNLTGNQIEAIESHGFFYNPDFRNPYTEYNALKIKVLDLSNNKFEVVPWNSIKRLEQLEQLFLSRNPGITELNDGDLVQSEFELDSFKSLKSLHFDSCRINYIKADTLKNFKNLKFLNLASNYLYNINENVGSILYQLGGVSLNLNNNKLKCDCKLLWLKKYLLKYGPNNPECILNKPNVTATILVEKIPVNLVNNPNMPSDQTTSLPDLTEPFRQIKNDEYRRITELDDVNFICELKFKDPGQWFQIKELENRYEITLKCLVRGYPEPTIRWNEDNKSLNKKSTYKMFMIEEKEVDEMNKEDSYSKLIESTLKFIMVTPIRPSLNGYRNYTCRAMLNTKMLKNQEDFKIETVQKMVNFEIYHGVDYGYNSWFPTSYQTINPIESVPRSNSFNSNPSYVRKNERPFIYWIIMSCVVLFILVFVLFTSFCIVRNNHESAKMREELQFLGPATYTANKRSAIYLTTPSSNRRQSPIVIGDRSLIEPLKPDNIREHQDYSSLHYNQTNCSPSSDSMHYSNIHSGSPTSAIMNGAVELESPDVGKNVSFDMDPVIESSPADSCNDSDDASRSFDENISEYEDPELVDLRSPGQKRNAN